MHHRKAQQPPLVSAAPSHRGGLPTFAGSPRREEGHITAAAVTTPPPVIPRQPPRASRELPVNDGCPVLSTPPFLSLHPTLACDDSLQALSSRRPRTFGDGAAGPSPSARLAAPKAPASASARLGEPSATGTPLLQSQWPPASADGFFAVGAAASYPQTPCSTAVGTGLAATPRQSALQQPLSVSSRSLPGIAKASVPLPNEIAAGPADVWTLTGPATYDLGASGISEHSFAKRAHASPSVSAQAPSRGPHIASSSPPHESISASLMSGANGREPLCSSGRIPLATARAPSTPRGKSTAHRSNTVHHQTPPRRKARTPRGAADGRAIVSSPPALPRAGTSPRLAPGVNGFALPSPIGDSSASALTVSRTVPQPRSERAPAAAPVAAADAAPSPPRRGPRTQRKESSPPSRPMKRRKQAGPKTGTPQRPAETPLTAAVGKRRGKESERGGRPTTHTTSRDSTGYTTAERHIPASEDETVAQQRHREGDWAGRPARRPRQRRPSPPSGDGSSEGNSTLTHTSVTDSRQEGVDASDGEADEEGDGAPRKRHSVDPSGWITKPRVSCTSTTPQSRETSAAPRSCPATPRTRRGSESNGPAVNLDAAAPGVAGQDGTDSLGIALVAVAVASGSRVGGGSVPPSASGSAALSHSTRLLSPCSAPNGSAAIRRGLEGFTVLPSAQETRPGDVAPPVCGRQPRHSSAALLSSPLSAQSASLRSLEEGPRPIGADTAVALPAVTAGPAYTARTSARGCTVTTKERSGRTGGGLQSGAAAAERRRSESMGTGHRQKSPQSASGSPAQRSPQVARRSFQGGGGSPPTVPPPATGGGVVLSGAAVAAGAASARPSTLLPGSPPPTQAQLANAEYVRRVKEQRRREFYAWNEMARKRAEGDENAV